MIEIFENPLSPDERYGALLSAVQEGRIFPDGMDFVRMRPLSPDDLINTEFAALNGDISQLPDFVSRHFEPLVPLTSRYQKQERTLDEHARYMLTDVLVCYEPEVEEPHIAVPFRTVSPDDIRFGRVKFNWDDDPTMDGILALGDYELANDIAKAKGYLRDKYGFEFNGTLTCFADRSQPMVYANCVDMLSEAYIARGGSPTDPEYPLVKYLPQMVHEMQWWERGIAHLERNPGAIAHEHMVRMPEGYMFRYHSTKATPRPESYRQDVETAKLAQHYNKAIDLSKVFTHIRSAAESGFDFSANRWCADGMNMHTIRTTDLLPVDHNALAVHTKRKIAEAYRLSSLTPGKDDSYIRMAQHEAMRFDAEAKQLGGLINKYCWSEETGLYHDYDFVRHYQDQTPIHANQTRAQSLATVFPLFAGIASAGQARSVAQRLKQDFLLQGGLATTLQNTEQQWDGDMSWPILNRKAQKALEKYGHDDVAGMIRGRFVAATSKIYNETGKVYEKINARTISKGTAGEYDVTGDFAMSLGVVAAMRKEIFDERDLLIDDMNRKQPRRRFRLALVAAALAFDAGSQA